MHKIITSEVHQFEDILEKVKLQIAHYFTSKELCKFWNENFQPLDGRTLNYVVKEGFYFE